MWHGAGIATHAFSGFFFFSGFIRHIDELGTQGLDLLFHAGAHIGGFNDRTQALGCGNGLQTGHAYTQDHDACGLDRARRRHEHGEEALVFVHGQHHGFVARDIGLGGQDVHALGAGGAGCGFQCKTGQARSSDALQAFSVKRVEHAHQSSTRLHVAQLGAGWRTNFEHQFGTQGACGVGDLGTRSLIGCIGHAGSDARTRLHMHLMPLGNDFFGRLRGHGDTGFARRGFGRHAYQHGFLLHSMGENHRRFNKRPSKWVFSTMTYRWKPSVTVAGIIEKEGRFLLVEEHTPKGLMFNNPAGHLDPGESPIDGCIREVLEETAYQFKPTALLGVYLSRFTKPAVGPDPEEDITYLRFAFTGELGDFDPSRQLDTGIVRTLWMSLEEMQASHERHRSRLLLRCAEDHLKGQRFPLDTIYTDASVLLGGWPP